MTRTNSGKIFFTADQHFGHARIIDLCGRPFSDVDEMNNSLVERWNRVVTERDTVFVLGDWALGRIRDTIKLTDRCNGTKILVSGNHDRCWEGHRKLSAGQLSKWKIVYLDGGFYDIRSGTPASPLRQFINNEFDDDVFTGVIMSHFPYRGDSHDRDRHASQRPIDNGEWLLHGHVHERWLQRGRMINVGVDAWCGFPVPEAMIAQLIAQGPQDRQPTKWVN